ncbi:MAG: hypothetical protein JWO63_622 [Frankiales bacterium]|jgi:hypothetical protein|nr:hypothetical protein [Frankiales bacterium]
MPIVPTVKEITCPRCGTHPAKFIQNDYYALDQSAPVDQRLELECPRGCIPSQNELRAFRSIQVD